MGRKDVPRKDLLARLPLFKDLNGAARLAADLVRQARGAPRLAWTLPAAKGEVASQLKLSAEHFSRILHELAASGLLQVQRRRITVPDTQRLQRATAPR